MLLCLVSSVYAISPAAHATDSSGTVKNEFSPIEDVYGLGQFELTTYACISVGEACSGDVDLYVVNAKTWTGGIGELLIEVGDGVETTSVSGTCINSTSGLECKILMLATKIWSATTSPGDYDFAIDINQDGILGSKEPIDDALIVGFTVLPEFTTVGAALVLLGSGFGYAHARRWLLDFKKLVHFDEALRRHRVENGSSEFTCLTVRENFVIDSHVAVER